MTETSTVVHAPCRTCLVFIRHPKDAGLTVPHRDGQCGWLPEHWPAAWIKEGIEFMHYPACRPDGGKTCATYKERMPLENNGDRILKQLEHRV